MLGREGFVCRGLFVKGSIEKGLVLNGSNVKNALVLLGGDSVLA